MLQKHTCILMNQTSAKTVFFQDQLNYIFLLTTRKTTATGQKDMRTKFGVKPQHNIQRLIIKV